MAGLLEGIGTVLAGGIAGASKAAGETFAEQMKQQALAIREENMARIADIYATKRQEAGFAHEKDMAEDRSNKDIFLAGIRQGYEQENLQQRAGLELTHQEIAFGNAKEVADRVADRADKLELLKNGNDRQKAGEKLVDDLYVISQNKQMLMEVEKFRSGLAASEPTATDKLVKTYQRLFGQKEGLDMFRNQMKDDTSKERMALFGAIVKSADPGSLTPAALQNLYNSVQQMSMRGEGKAERGDPDKDLANILKSLSPNKGAPAAPGVRKPQTGNSFDPLATVTGGLLNSATEGEPLNPMEIRSNKILQTRTAKAAADAEADAIRTGKNKEDLQGVRSRFNPR